MRSVRRDVLLVVVLVLAIVSGSYTKPQFSTRSVRRAAGFVQVG
jgi:hypothetical protein